MRSVISSCAQNIVWVRTLKVANLLSISAILICYHTKSKMLPSLSFTTSHTHKVTNLKAVNTTTNSTTITWDQPPHNYRVLLQGEATDNIIQSRVVNVTGQTTHIVEGLNPFQKYTISVYLESNLGQGSSATVTFQTLGRGESAEDTPKCLCKCQLGT